MKQCAHSSNYSLICCVQLFYSGTAEFSYNNYHKLLGQIVMNSWGGGGCKLKECVSIVTIKAGKTILEECSHYVIFTNCT